MENLEKKEPVAVDEIPVAFAPENAENGLLPKTVEEVEDDELVVKFRKPFNFEGETYYELNLQGLEDLNGRTLTNIEKAFVRTGVSSFVPETTTTYAKIVATKVTNLPPEFFEELPAGEIQKIKNVVVGFLYKDE